MKKWCKIYEIAGHQVLVRRDFEGEDKTEFVNIIVCMDGSFAKIGFGYDSEKGADEAFETIDEEVVTGIIGDLLND